MSIKAFNEAIARRRAAERAARPVDPAGYLNQLLVWAAQYQRAEPVVRREETFKSYAYRIRVNAPTAELRETYIQKLREQCDSIAAAKLSLG